MRNVARTIALALSPVAAVYASVFALQAAGLPFPPEADAAAWPAWLLFGGLVFGINAVLVCVARRLPGPHGEVPAARSADAPGDRRSPAA
ncbi:MAG: hypothetical protein WCK28_16775 [Burkholderiales bacterium]